METSESGSPIYRYNASDKNEFQGASGENSTEEIQKHIEKYIGKITMVYHEIVSDQVHIDIHWIEPTQERPFHTFVTSGMSDKAMNFPAGLEDFAHAELSICLPADWKVKQEDFENEENYWPLRWLKIIARFPHEYNTWLSYGHTIPNGDPAQGFAKNTNLNTMLLLPSTLFHPEFQTLELENKTINFFALYPLYSEEVKLKMKKGVEALFDGFHQHDVSDLLDVSRPNTIKRKKWMGIF